MPVAPGSFGSATGLVVLMLVRFSGSAALEAALIVLLFGLGVWSAGIAERHFGTVDPGPVVIDEVMGMLVTLAFLPVGWQGALVGWFLFRVCDVVKPYPTARLEKLPGGLGVMADDAMAAVYAHLLLRLMFWLKPGLAG